MRGLVRWAIANDPTVRRRFHVEVVRGTVRRLLADLGACRAVEEMREEAASRDEP